MTDLISRADAMGIIDSLIDNDYLSPAAKMYSARCAISALPSAEAKGANLINRHDATTVIREECWKCNRLINADLLGRILALPTSRQTDCTEFIEWLIEIILDDEDWELNAVGYGEIIARKMAKLGLLEVLDGYYIRTPNKPQNVVAEIKIDADEIVSKVISALSAVQGWIPFTRRPMTEEEQKDYPNCTFMFDCVLPDDGDEILVSNGRFVWMDTFCNDIDGCYLDGGDDIDEDMAWMPLPKPYREDDEV